MSLGMDRSFARALKQALRDGQFRKARPSRATAPVDLSGRVRQIVSITSVTQVDDRYPGTWHVYDAGDKDCVDQEVDVWVVTLNGEGLEEDTFYTATLYGVVDGVSVFAVDAAGGGAGGGALTVQEVDGAPSVTSVSELRFDQADGFAVTNPGAGIARVDFAPVFSGARVYQSGNQTLTGTTTLAFDTELYDTDGYHSNSTNNSRLTAPSAGVFLVGGALVTEISGVDYTIEVNVTDNTGTSHARCFNSSPTGALMYDSIYVPFTTIVSLGTSDYVELIVTNVSGANKASRGLSRDATNFWIVKLGN